MTWEMEQGGPCRRSMDLVLGCEQQRRAAAARVSHRCHRATPAAVAMDLGPPSSIGGREVEVEDRDNERRDVAAADGGRRKEIWAVVC